MAVKDVYRPEKTNPTDPIKPSGKGETYWENRKKEKRAQREALEEEKMMEDLKHPVTQPEPAFQVQGGIKLDIDPQRDAARERQARQDQQEKDNEKIANLTTNLDKTKGDLQQSQITAAMKEMAGQFTSALKEMNERIASVKSGADPAILATQFDALTKVAEKMGFQKSTPQIGDPLIQLEITKLNIESAQRDREFQARLAQESRQWDLEKLKLEDDRAVKRGELALSQERNEMFAKAPGMIGTAIGQALIASGGETAQPASPAATPKRNMPPITAGVGESGEVKCTVCKQPVAIAPTAKKAVCAGCGAQYSIQRTQAESPVEAGEE